MHHWLQERNASVVTTTVGCLPRHARPRNFVAASSVVSVVRCPPPTKPCSQPLGRKRSTSYNNREPTFCGKGSACLPTIRKSYGRPPATFSIPTTRIVNGLHSVERQRM